MHPVLAQALAERQMAQPSRMPSTQELALIERMADLERQAILVERMSASVNADHGASVRSDLSDVEVAAFTTQWGTGILDTCLRAGVTSGEVRHALRTGDLPDGGLVQALAEFRSLEPPATVS